MSIDQGEGDRERQRFVAVGEVVGLLDGSIIPPQSRYIDTDISVLGIRRGGSILFGIDGTKKGEMFGFALEVDTARVLSGDSIYYSGKQLTTIKLEDLQELRERLRGVIGGRRAKVRVETPLLQPEFGNTLRRPSFISEARYMLEILGDFMDRLPSQSPLHLAVGRTMPVLTELQRTFPS